MYNDFAAGSNGYAAVVGGSPFSPALPDTPSLAAFAAPANTVLVGEGSGRWAGQSDDDAVVRYNVGHCAWFQHWAYDTLFSQTGLPMSSAQTLFDAGKPENRATRHNGSGNYLMADGHARLTTVGWTSDTDVTARRTTGVYYPPNGKSGPTHSANEPDPAGDMSASTPAAGRIVYRATFQIN